MLVILNDLLSANRMLYKGKKRYVKSLYVIVSLTKKMLKYPLNI